MAAALVLAALALLATRQMAVALPVLLDLLLVAGLLRLEATASWEAIGAAGAIVLIRKLATFGITSGARPRTLPSPVDQGR